MLTDAEQNVLEGLLRELQNKVNNMRLNCPPSLKQEYQKVAVDICLDLGNLAELAKRRMERWKK